MEGAEEDEVDVDGTEAEEDPRQDEDEVNVDEDPEEEATGGHDEDIVDEDDDMFPVREAYGYTNDDSTSDVSRESWEDSDIDECNEDELKHDEEDDPPNDIP